MAHPRFRDRIDAGEQLAGAIAARAVDDPLVLALPRGGVIVGAAVAERLGADLDVLVCRKLGVPGRRELAMGALAEGGLRVLNEEVVAAMRIAAEEIDRATANAEVEIARQVERYRGGRPPAGIAGRQVVVVDDGLATGMTAEAAVRAVARERPAGLLLAVPVCGPESAERLRGLAEDVICCVEPQDFMAVGMWYVDFSQTTDEEVIERLAEGRRRTEDSAV